MMSKRLKLLLTVFGASILSAGLNVLFYFLDPDFAASDMIVISMIFTTVWAFFLLPALLFTVVWVKNYFGNLDFAQSFRVGYLLGCGWGVLAVLLLIAVAPASGTLWYIQRIKTARASMKRSRTTDPDERDVFDLNEYSEKEKPMTNVYKSCPVFENEHYLLRLVEDADADGLLKVYGDEKAVPFFNGDNCHGDDFHYTSSERMKQAVSFWREAYKNGWFVRWTVIDKRTGVAVGTIENFHRDADDFFTNCALLRLDLRSDYESADEICGILAPVLAPSFDLFGCDKIATKAVPAAAERRKALLRLGFTPSSHPLIGDDGTHYGDYFVLEKN